MFKLLKNKNAVTLWISRALSRFGDALETLALMYLVYDLTGSGLAMGTIMLFSMLPNVLISPISGVIVDRYNKKAIMFCSEIVRAIAIAIIPLLMYIEVIEFWHICFISVVVSIAESFFEPCSGVVFRLVVKKEELPLLNSLSTTTNNIMRIVGYSASTLIMITIGKEILFLFDSITFLISGVAALTLKLPKLETKKIENFKEIAMDFVEGLKYLNNKKILIVLLLSIFTVNALSTPVLNFIPILTEKVMKIDPQWAGYFLTIASVGGIIGVIVYPIILKTKMTLYKMFLFSFIVLGGITLLPVYFSSEISGIILFFIIGTIGPILGTWSFTKIQTSCDIKFLGRVGAVTNIALLASVPLFAAIAGWGIDLISLENILIVSSVLYVIFGVFIYFMMLKHSKVEEVNNDSSVINKEISEV